MVGWIEDGLVEGNKCMKRGWGDGGRMRKGNLDVS